MSDATRPLRRVRYFQGQLLTATDLQAEQDYFRERLRRHNLCLLGSGVVRDLGVSVKGSSAIVAAGYAIAPDGEDLFVSEPLTLLLHATGGRLT